ncbi:Transposase [gamma proteobacterium IMCC1989]|nr:Transposase [gamma proteobacterium IMCC1989]
MPRQPRFVLVGHPQHVIIRGNNRDPIFYSDSDYRFYLEKLREASQKHDCSIHAYVLMTNHVHLLVTPNKENSISKMVQMLGRYYVQYFNYRYRRTGTLWEGRYKASLIDSERYALLCYRYIELNPVRANMVNHPSEYPWSSYRHNAVDTVDELIVEHEVYLSLSSNDIGRKKAYRELFLGHIEGLDLACIREMTNKGWVLGSEYFKEKISRQVNRQLAPLPRGGDRSLKKRAK